MTTSLGEGKLWIQTNCSKPRQSTKMELLSGMKRSQFCPRHISWVCNEKEFSIITHRMYLSHSHQVRDSKIKQSLNHVHHQNFSTNQLAHLINLWADYIPTTAFRATKKFKELKKKDPQKFFQDVAMPVLLYGCNKTHGKKVKWEP